MTARFRSSAARAACLCALIPSTAGRRLAVAALLSMVAAVACGGGGAGEEVRVRVPAGASFHAITDSLHAHGVVDQPFLFRVFARISGADRRVQPGTYAFRQGEAWGTILEDLRTGRILTTRMVIPEGWDLRRIAPILAQVTGQDQEEILQVLFDSATAAGYGVPGPNLEGYLYPATYTLPVDAPLDWILLQLVNRYNAVWTAERRARADSLGMSEKEVVTLASIVEKEARHRHEMPLIAAVYHNRLRIGYPLQADPTVQYALGDHRSRLLYADIDDVADHPYSTYHRTGLPPGPIGSPSAMAIDATLWPADADFLYFVAAPDGTHVFTRSLDEHNRARAAIRRGVIPETQGIPATGAPTAADP
ncbi:MAG TPA: endolytic transglycosylase MltG [Longimicrobiales bacterium]|nr:endolytic transglycosylase MltG [Longimicrobiales bacterium]